MNEGQTWACEIEDRENVNGRKMLSEITTRPNDAKRETFVGTKGNYWKGEEKLITKKTYPKGKHDCQNVNNRKYTMIYEGYTRELLRNKWKRRKTF